MSYGLVSEPEFEGSEEGIRRRRADYLVLAYLRAVEVASIEELADGVSRIASDLEEADRSVPVSFESGGSNGRYSRELNEALDRCLHFEWVDQRFDGRYRIDERGRDLLIDSERFEAYGVNVDFQETVQTIVDDRF